MLVTVLAAIAMYALRPAWLAPTTLALAATTLPSFLPAGFGFGGFYFRFYEIFLLAAAAWAIFRVGVKRRTAVTALLLTLWILIGLSVAFITAAEPAKIVGDIRYPVELILAVLIADASIQNINILKNSVRTLRLSLWISTTFTIFASVGLMTLQGRSEIAALLESSSAAGATRFLTASTFFALATVCVCVGLAIVGKYTIWTTWLWWTPALILLFLAFSRNHLVGIAVAVAISLLAVRNTGTLLRALAGIASALVLMVGILAVSPALTDLPGGAWLSTQVESYSTRVVEGLGTQTLARDPSTQYRESEVARLQTATLRSPVIGNGFGFAYQPPRDEPGSFWFTRAPYYAHNFYWWTLAKTGIAGFSLLICAIVWPVARTVIASKSRTAAAVAASASGLLAVSWFAPLPLDSPAAVALGLLLGAITGSSYFISVNKRDSQKTVRQDSSIGRVKSVQETGTKEIHFLSL